MENNNNLIEIKEKTMSVFSSMESFDNAQRMAKVLSSSSLVPKSYQNNIPNTMIALEMANRVGVSPFMVMQNMDVIHGKPSWSSSFIISVLNSCGRFKPLRFKKVGTEGQTDYGYIAYTHNMDGELLESPAVTWKMVMDEGWRDKAGSKWKTMPELMFQYRCASFFGRLYAPDILKGMHTVDEVQDISSKKETITIINAKELE